MAAYLMLLRGINVGGKNIITMAALKQCLEDAGFTEVSTYIASGNVILHSVKTQQQIKKEIEALLIKSFTFDSKLIKVLALSVDQLRKIIEDKPSGFGEQPAIFHSDVIFLMDITVHDAMKIFSPKEGVDTIWPGTHVIYSQRLSELRTKSRLNKIISSKLYKSMTIRSWNTTAKLFALLKDSVHD